MKLCSRILIGLATLLLCGNLAARAEASTTEKPLQFRDLFNGKDLTGWIDVNTSKETWTVHDGMIVSTGKPIGVMRSDRQYENFILEIEWRHMTAGGNSGVFVWSNAAPPKGKRLPNGVEVQMLELEWAPQHNETDAYVHGELFGVGGIVTDPDNPRGSRSKSIEKRCKGKGEWNKYVVVCVDGTIKLSVNGKFVNGISKSTARKGYLCLEAEGAEIHFRNIRILELPPGLANAENTAPVIEEKNKENSPTKKPIANKKTKTKQ